MTPRAAGVLLVLASTAPFALAGIFTRQIAADLWSLLAFAMLILGEVPPAASWIGGAIIIAAVGVSAALGVRARS